MDSLVHSFTGILIRTSNEGLGYKVHSGIVTGMEEGKSEGKEAREQRTNLSFYNDPD